MNLLGSNISITIREKAFGDVPQKLKKLEKVFIGKGDGYSSNSQNKNETPNEKKYIKLYFENAENQTTKTLSLIRPVHAPNLKNLLQDLKTLLQREDIQVKGNVDFETDCLNPKDKKQVKGLIKRLS